MSQSQEPESFISQPPYGEEGPGRTGAASLGPVSRMAGPVRRQMPAPVGRSRLAWGLIALVLLAGGAGGVLAYAARQGGGPARAAADYCTALKAHEYAAAYGSLTTALRAPWTLQRYADEAKLQERIDGSITQCLVVNATDDGSNGIWRDLSVAFGGRNSATVRMTITRARLGVRDGTVTMLRQADGWKIGQLEAALQGTPLAPLHVADQFCTALVAGDYKTAFGDLSARQVGLEQSEATFASQVALPAGTRYTSCILDYAGYKVAGSTATLPLTLNIAVTTPTGVPVIPAKGSVTLVAERGTWKLDGLDLPTSSG